MSQRTLYLGNLPRRPASEANFTRLVLHAINSQNPYVQNHDLPIPQVKFDTLPNDNRRVFHDPLSSENIVSAYANSKQSLLDSVANEDELCQEVLRKFFDSLDTLYQPEFARNLTIGGFRKLFRQLQSQQDQVHSLSDHDLTRILAILRDTEAQICLKSRKHLSLLDPQYGVVAISRSRRGVHDSQGFLTFINHDRAREFLERFKGQLKIRGRKIHLSFSSQDSLLGAYLHDGKRAVQKSVADRVKQGDESEPNKTLDDGKTKLKRQLRRLRHKLRLKGIEAEEIQRIVQRIQREKSAVIEAPTPSSRAKSQGSTQEMVPAKKITIAEVSGNPPNKILLAQRLPNGVSHEEVSLLFQAEGLVEVRLVSVRNVAFIEFINVSHASNMLNKLGTSFPWKNSAVSLGFAK
ncbi:LADA_0C03950g1_1 [Lachancea dasiensis]|uniref:LADA_0C03950g1_1 n=1 Tax=Lachancea dasiensis TaxID=1072105 RepID=A0A1G4IYE4_9SACH|nr:LADA_0C03950g1_1 [Lachancea dasiensis]